MNWWTTNERCMWVQVIKWIELSCHSLMYSRLIRITVGSLFLNHNATYNLIKTNFIFLSSLLSCLKKNSCQLQRLKIGKDFFFPSFFKHYLLDIHCKRKLKISSFAIIFFIFLSPIYSSQTKHIFIQIYSL